MKCKIIKNIVKVFFAALFFVSFSASVLSLDSGAMFIPLENSSLTGFTYLEGIASWYAEFSPGIRPTTANMEIFNHNKLTCAIWGLPFNTMVEVTNLNNGRSVIVRVNDRGPAKRLCRKGRIIDLTMSAFGKIEKLDKGLTKVKIRVIK